MSSHRWMLIGIVAGAVLGLTANTIVPESSALAWIVEYLTEPAGKLFLRLLFMLVVPLIFSALVMGVCELDLKHLGRLGLKTLGYTVVVSFIAVVIGLTLVNAIGPGRGLSDDTRKLALSSKTVQAATAPKDTSGVGLLIAVIPDNPVKAAASGDMIGLIAFSILFGIALALSSSEGARTLRSTIQGLYDVSMRLIDMVLKLAPIGVGALLFTMTARLGTNVLHNIAAYVGVVVLGLAIHQFVVYSLSVKFLGGRNPFQFFRDVWLAIVTAFSTASSSATLPTALKVAEENLKLPKHVSRFVLTAGSTMNQNGTALFEGVTVLFLAQLFGVEMTLAKQAIVMLICVLAGIGTAGVPAGSLPVIAMILGMFGIPPEGLGLILGIDRVLDMCRTTVNVTGDLAAAVFVARGEGDAKDHGGL